MESIGLGSLWMQVTGPQQQGMAPGRGVLEKTRQQATEKAVYYTVSCADCRKIGVLVAARDTAAGWRRREELDGSTQALKLLLADVIRVQVRPFLLFSFDRCFGFVLPCRRRYNAGLSLPHMDVCTSVRRHTLTGLFYVKRRMDLDYYSIIIKEYVKPVSVFTLLNAYNFYASCHTNESPLSLRLLKIPSHISEHK